MKLFRNSHFRWFIFGFAFGLLGSVVYVRIEGNMSVFYPMWARIAGFPGVVAGEWFYHYFGSFQWATAFGCVVNGFAYGLIFLLVAMPVRKFLKSPE